MSDSSPTAAPQLSIVIGLIAGDRESMESCLAALEPGAKRLSAEVLAPFDARLQGVDDLRRQFPWCEFIDARGRVDIRQFGSHSREHHDILRAIGLSRARGRIVGMLEDHGTPAPGWCDSMLAAHYPSRDPVFPSRDREGAVPVVREHAEPLPHGRGSERNERGSELQTPAAVGGAVENGVDKLLNWAVYFCDFARYMGPVPTGPAEFVSDSNVSYKREALHSVHDLWQDAFHETSVNWELRRRGNILVLDPGMTIHQTRRTLRFFPALMERFVWGRSFAGTRAREISTAKRMTLAALSFLLPAVLTVRIVKTGLAKHRNLGPLLASLPLILLLQSFWALGEFVGYLTGRTG